MNELSQQLVLVIIFVLLGTAGAIFKSGQRSPRRNYRDYRPSSPTREPRYERQLDDFPYQLQEHFLTPAELTFWKVIRPIVGDRAVICSKVRLGDIFSVEVEDRSTYLGYNNKVNRKHVDFLLCAAETMRPLVGIELDDSSHQRDARQARDTFVDGVFAAADLPLLHIAVKRTYSLSELEAQLAPYLGVAIAPTVAPPTPAPKAKTESKANATPPPKRAPITAPAPPLSAPTPKAETVESPPCPKCGSKMTLRVIKGGNNAGNKFWGCSTYPTCRGMVSYQASSVTIQRNDNDKGDIDATS